MTRPTYPFAVSTRIGGYQFFTKKATTLTAARDLAETECERRLIAWRRKGEKGPRPTVHVWQLKYEII